MESKNVISRGFGAHAARDEYFLKTVGIATGQDKGPGAPEIVLWEIAWGKQREELMAWVFNN